MNHLENCDTSAEDGEPGGTSLTDGEGKESGFPAGGNCPDTEDDAGVDREEDEPRNC